MNFELKHIEGKLIAIVIIDGNVHEKDVTNYFEGDNPHDDWLDHRLGFTINTLPRK